MHDEPGGWGQQGDWKEEQGELRHGWQLDDLPFITEIRIVL